MTSWARPTSRIMLWKARFTGGWFGTWVQVPPLKCHRSSSPKPVASLPPLRNKPPNPSLVSAASERGDGELAGVKFVHVVPLNDQRSFKSVLGPTVGILIPPNTNAVPPTPTSVVAAAPTRPTGEGESRVGAVQAVPLNVDVLPLLSR